MGNKLDDVSVNGYEIIRYIVAEYSIMWLCMLS
jgi:hypothetical protein